MNPKMSSHNRDILLQVLMHYLPADVRAKVIREAPEAYNDFHGDELFTVIRTSDLPADRTEPGGTRQAAGKTAESLHRFADISRAWDPESMPNDDPDARPAREPDRGRPLDPRERR